MSNVRVGLMVTFGFIAQRAIVTVLPILGSSQKMLAEILTRNVNLLFTTVIQDPFVDWRLSLRSDVMVRLVG